VFLRTSDEGIAGDIAGEVFLRLLKALHAGRPPHTTLRGWLYGVASHLLSDHYHGRPQVELSEWMADGHSVQTEAEERLRQADVQAAVKRLTADQQEALVLRFGSGLSLEETANAMNKSVTAVKALQFRAIEALRQVLVEVDDG
jgi:RNA polymerase sigma-70 factor (ECF subfamily)